MLDGAEHFGTNFCHSEKNVGMKGLIVHVGV